MEIILVEEGGVVFQAGNKSYLLERGDMLLINPFEPHSGFIPDEYKRTVYCVVNLDNESFRAVPVASLQSIFEELTNGSGVYCMDNYDSDTKAQMLDCLRKVISLDSEETRLTQLGYMFNFLGLLGAPIPVDRAKESRRSAKFVKETVLYIQNTPSHEISLDAVAKLLSYNKAYFTTIFKKNFGMSFTDYVNNYKIEKARELIRNGNYNLNDVATKSGFNYYAYFFKKFKLITGVSPSEFVEQCRSRK